jgi:predicted amidohydrolase YtcJ
MTMADRFRPTAVAVQRDRIVAVGSDEEIVALAGPKTNRVNLAGRTVLPGLADVHTHVASNARDPRHAECRDFIDESVTSIGAILSRIRAVAAGRGPEEWVVGIGGVLQQTRLMEGRLPTKEELDDATDHRPGFLTFGPHLIIATSAALELAGIGRDTTDPQGGEIVRKQDGTPTGVLRERAQQMVRRLVPAAAEDLEERIHRELLECARRGVTTIHDVVKAPAEVRAYQRLEQQGRLPVRVHLLIRVFHSEFESLGLRDLGLETGFGSDLLRIGGVKMSIDGGDDQRSGFSPQPGDEERDVRQLIRMRQRDLDPIIADYHAAGMRVCVHAIGDHALDMALDGFAKALAASPRVDHRHRVEHMGNFMMTDERLRRAHEMGLTPVPNPSTLYYAGDAAEHGLGPERTVDAFPFRRLLESGTPFVIASDGPGMWPINPMRDIATCGRRTTRSGQAFSPGERIDVLAALTALTSTAAWLGLVEDEVGTIEPGKLADLDGMT